MSSPIAKEEVPSHHSIVDLDSHVIEPWDLWQHSMEGALRVAAPRPVEDSWGIRRLMVESQLFPTPEGRGRAPRRLLTAVENEVYKERIETSQSPVARLAMMDQQGISKAMLMPSQGLVIGAISDGELATAVARTYNNWLSNYCRLAPDRLLGAAILGLQSPQHALEELRRVVGSLELRAIILKPNPVAGRNLNDAAYYPIFEMCETLGLPIFIHEGCGYAPGATLGIDRFENGLFSHLFSHPFEQMAAMAALILGGVLERFPRLRIAFLEAGCGWTPYWLSRMDEHAEKLSWEVPWLSMPPSSYFRRQCIVACEPDEEIPQGLVSGFAQNIAFGSDFPHSDQIEMEDAKHARCFEGLPPDAKIRVMNANAEWFLSDPKR
jgi:predicted TIM-barrel fold metal-dependent hydrolase